VVSQKVIDDGDGSIPVNERNRRWMESHAHLLTLVKENNQNLNEEKEGNIEEENDDDSDDETIDLEEKTSKRKTRSPFKAEWIAPIIRVVVAETPKAPISVLKVALSPYLQDYTMTKTLLQNAQRLARCDVFGNPDENAKYILALRDEMEKLGHPVEVFAINRDQAIKRLMLTVLSEKVRCQFPAKVVFVASTIP